MAYVRKRKSDQARGKAGKWTVCWIGADGKRKSKVGLTDKAESQRLANHLEEQARLVREGLVDPKEKARRQAGLRAVADHCADYRLDLLAKGDTAKHARHSANSARKLLDAAGVESIADIAPDRIRAALGRMRAANKSARTCNHALGAVKSLATWLLHANRIDEVPRGLGALKPYNEKEDRRVVRRALNVAEIARLLAATELGPPVKLSRRGYRYPERWISGPERAALYRLAMGTGFRAKEIRTLTPERFALGGDEPSITVLACYSKNGREAIQPITRELAAAFRPFLEGKPAGEPVLDVPARTAQLLRVDLKAAGIAAVDATGRIVDFHALRHAYITHLSMSGVNPKVVQALARHSTITLTLDRYTHAEAPDLRAALDRGDDPKGGEGKLDGGDPAP